jgi:hypothetical protein
MEKQKTPGRITRRKLVVGGAALAFAAAAGAVLRNKILRQVERFTRLPEFSATPALAAHDPARDKTSLFIAQGGTPHANIDAALDKLGGLEPLIGKNDVVIVKVSAQWWNQGMTNVGAVKRMLEAILAVDGFEGEVIVFENTHFRLKNGSGLSRAFTHPSVRNVDVDGWNKLGDLVDHFEKTTENVSFVGLVDGGPSALSGDRWHDPEHVHGIYGGDERGPIEPGDPRDGYHWDFGKTFRRKRSWVSHAQVPLTWPRFTSPRSGLVVDFKDGLFRREDGKLAAVDRKVFFINMTTANEHIETGITACCKSAMGIVDMSAGRLGTDPRVADYQSVHYFGKPEASWRMAGPLAHFANEVRAPDLYVTVAQWVGTTPSSPDWPDDGEAADLRLEEAAAHEPKTIVMGRDPVAIDHWVAKNVLSKIGGKHASLFDVDDPESKVTKFLRYYREVRGQGTLDPALVDVS